MPAEDDLTYRPIPDGRGEEVAAILRYAFNPESGPFDPERWGGPSATHRASEPRGLFDGDDLLTVCRHYFFDSRVRGAAVTLAGVAAVATPPEHRRRGLVRRLMREALAEYRERGAPLAALWPFSFPFYAKLGWATASRYAESECPPSALSFGREARGRYVRLAPEDHSRMAQVLAADASGYELAVDRTESWWRTRVFQQYGSDRFVYGVERDGDLVGYVAYDVEDGDDGRVLVVHEMAAVDHEARRSCLGFLADHDSQVGRVQIRGPPDSVLLDVVADPEEVDTAIHAGAMVRAVSVPAALESVSYPADVEADLVVGVEDSLAAWNDGAFRLSVADGGAAAEPADADPDVEVGIGPLSQLVVGYRTADSLAETGELAGDDDAIEALDRLFPPHTPYLRERF